MTGSRMAWWSDRDWFEAQRVPVGRKPGKTLVPLLRGSITVSVEECWWGKLLLVQARAASPESGWREQPTPMRQAVPGFLASHFVPRPNSPEHAHAIARLVARLHLSPCTAEVGLGYAYGLSKKEIAAWLDKSEFAIDGLGRRLYLRLGIHSQQGVAGLVGRTLAEVDAIPSDQRSLIR